MPQILVLLEKTIDLYPSAIVVLAFLTEDLDRSVLPMRSYPRMYCTVEGTNLVFRGIPVQTNMASFASLHPPRTKSYLLALLKNSNTARRWFGPDSETSVREKLNVNTAILDRAVRLLRDRNRTWIMLVFQPNQDGVHMIDDKSNWRQEFLTAYVAKNGIQCIWTVDLLKKKAKEGGVLNYDKAYFQVDAHPNDYYNKLVADEIKRRILGGTVNKPLSQ